MVYRKNFLRELGITFGRMRMKRRSQIYWMSQLGGWGLFVLGNIVIASMQEEPFEGLYIISLFILLIGILVTHFFRKLVHIWGWKKLNIPALLPWMLVSALVMSAVFTVFNTALTDLVASRIPLVESIFNISFVLNVFNFSALFLLWEIIYFAVNTFENWKREEILNLELKASKTEIELNSLKSQMNPHFMFNSMNSIRALVDENPEKAKHAITMLSGILRNNLTLGRFQTIAFKDEIDLVDKYLSLEKIRFEERLTIQLQIDPASLSLEIPPFLLQTLVENAIKHGISKKVQGGIVTVKSEMMTDEVSITITNTGTFEPQKNHEGIGLINSRKRLLMIYGERASLEIIPSQDVVVVKLIVPTKKIIA
jgi:two-component system LytT family sensor kinase